MQLESMTPPTQTKHSQPGSAKPVLVLIGTGLLLVSAVPPLCLFSEITWPAKGNDFGGGGMRIIAAAIGCFVITLPTAALGLFLIGKSRQDSRR